MEWDLGLEGLAVLAAIAAGFGAFAGLVVRGGVVRRAWAAVITTVLCFGVGLVTSEMLFGWATEEELQPNVDGLSRDEVLLSSVLTTAAVLLAMRFLAHRTTGHDATWHPHLHGHQHGRHAARV